MWCLAGIALLTLYATACNALPYDLAQHLAPTDVPLLMGETVVQTQLLTLKPNTTQQSTGSEQIKSRTVADDTSDKVIMQENNKISGPEMEEEVDYSSLVDIGNDPEDEYLDIDSDATPLNFLKQREVKRRAKVPPILTTAKNAGSAIYITVPIYINTSGGMPLTLTVGGQTVPLSGPNTQVTNMESPKEMEPPAKTSQFNRLLHFNDATNRNHRVPGGLRGANRNRSNLRSRNYARKHMSSPETFRKIGTYSFYF